LSEDGRDTFAAEIAGSTAEGKVAGSKSDSHSIDDSSDAHGEGLPADIPEKLDETQFWGETGAKGSVLCLLRCCGRKRGCRWEFVANYSGFQIHYVH
jgi:hypothetical protein